MLSIRLSIQVVTVLAGVVVPAIADVRVDLLGHWGGGTFAVKVHDGLAYVGVGPRLVILDVHDPTEPIRVGQTEPLGYYVTDIAVDGSLAYVTTYHAGFQVIDIGDPARPKLVGSYSFVMYDRALAVDKRGNDVFVLCDSGLHVFDLSDPSAPQRIASYVFPGTYSADDMTIAGDIAYVLRWFRLTLLDISDPHEPTFMSDFPTGLAEEIEVDDGYAYVAEDALLVVDVSDPYAPTFAARVELNSWADGWAVALGPDRVYLKDDANQNEITVIDRTDPTNPVQRGSAPMTCPLVGAIAVDGTNVFACDWYAGIRVLDAADADNPLQIGFYDEIGHSHMLSASDGLVFSSGYTPGIQVLDVTDPRVPRRVAHWGDRRYSHLELRGTTAYLASNRLTILDVTNLSDPVELGSLDLPGGISDLEVEQGYAYIAGHGETGGFAIVDVSNPGAPQLVSSVDDAPAFGVAVRGNRAYLATQDHGFRILDVSDPHSPMLLGTLDSIRLAHCVTVIDDVAFVGGIYGIQVVDVADPAAPRLLSVSLPESAYILRIAAYDRTIVVPSLCVIDATNPREPRLIGTYSGSGRGMGIAVADGVAYLGSSEGGVEIVAIRPPGDLDGNDHVDFRDLIQLLSAFGSSAGSDEYNLYADLDSDGRVA